jgi:hypothetical protein
LAFDIWTSEISNILSEILRKNILKKINKFLNIFKAFSQRQMIVKSKGVLKVYMGRILFNVINLKNKSNMSKQ